MGGDPENHSTLRAQDVGVSRTSQVVALIRAELDRPHTMEGDPDAQRRLCAGMQPISKARIRRAIVARTRFFDEHVLLAISAGIRQVVICGAGYDDRALRFRTEGVHFFELDHPSTQADKALRLRKMQANMKGLTLVPADLRSDDVVTLLGASGHDSNRPTLFICEGLLVYLDLQTDRRLFTALRFLASSSSRLAASVAILREGEAADRATGAANARRPSGETEPWLTILPAGAYLSVLRQTGWEIDRGVDSMGSGPRKGQGRMLLVTARPSPSTES